ncbi:hypothetical protein AHAS_Ahas13G0332200 [Arachis hypogaea]
MMTPSSDQASRVKSSITISLLLWDDAVTQRSFCSPRLNVIQPTSTCSTQRSPLCPLPSSTLLCLSVELVVEVQNPLTLLTLSQVG